MFTRLNRVSLIRATPAGQGVFLRGISTASSKASQGFPHVLRMQSFTSGPQKSTGEVEGVVPLIDLQPYFTGGDAGAEEVARKIGQACEDIGFLAVKNHQVPQKVIDDVWQASWEYFDLPVEEKKLIPMTEDYPYGYSEFEGENLAQGYGEKAVPDLKECMAIGPLNPASLMPEPIWPKRPASFRPAWEAYIQSMETLSNQMLELFALALNLPQDWFEEKVTHHRSCLRALNYPEQLVPPKPGQIRAGQHTDYGSLTILLQDDCGGLQVKTKAGEWHDVPPIPGAFVINIGDLMAMWTNDKWTSTLHRVTNPSADVFERRGHSRRQSLAFFHNINHDWLVECIPTCQSPENPPKYKPVLAWDHLMSKHSSAVDVEKKD